MCFLAEQVTVVMWLCSLNVVGPRVRHVSVFRASGGGVNSFSVGINTGTWKNFFTFSQLAKTLLDFSLILAQNFLVLLAVCQGCLGLLSSVLSSIEELSTNSS